MSDTREQAREAVHGEFPLRGTTDTPVYVRLADAASDVWEVRVRRLQRLVRIANGQLEQSFAPLAAFQTVDDDPALRAELEEALRG